MSKKMKFHMRKQQNNNATSKGGLHRILFFHLNHETVKTPLLVVLLLFFSSQNLLAQWFDDPVEEIDNAYISAKYRLTWVEDTNHIQQKSQEVFLLLLGSETSRFESYNHHRLYSIGRQKQQNGELAQWLQNELFNTNYDDLFYYKSSYRIYKNFPKGKITFREYLPFTGCFQYQEDLNTFCWNIECDTMKLNGYTVQKATTYYSGRQWVAWFTEEVPFSDGPYKFNGLPGLIVKISDSQKHYCFELLYIETSQKDEKIEFVIENCMKTDKKDFFDLTKKTHERLISNGIEPDDDIELKKRISQYYQFRNNPIELDWK